MAAGGYYYQAHIPINYASSRQIDFEHQRSMRRPPSWPVVAWWRPSAGRVPSVLRRYLPPRRSPLRCRARPRKSARETHLA
ncbi:hypothetical protein PsYK624_162020 [Phanerochaete sordida]|uniref:Uncharacterized protein n=1 Tax=Phanerochaete sordida TaxID=48140 RepID=A0A9P3LLV7_9APHY|nr:hypothetical protein PsYK624_162020 [Phanerochaete sordida]